MEILGYALAILIGVSLGLIGGGGSILTVPIMVYIFGFGVQLATSYSLFIVGLTAFVGSFNFYRHGNINVKTALVFVIPSITTVLITRKYIMPAIPEIVLKSGHFVITKDILIMTVFALLMIAASYSMISKIFSADHSKLEQKEFSYKLIIIEGFIVGFLSGFLGAGGGFLIIPALVLFARLPMKVAIGTSLMIVSINSMFGFTSDVLRGEHINWLFLLSISVFTISGTFIGTSISKRIPSYKLRPAFGYFILIMGVFILVNELVLKHQH